MTLAIINKNNSMSNKPPLLRKWVKKQQHGKNKDKNNTIRNKFTSPTRESEKKE